MTSAQNTFATTHWTRVLAARGETPDAKSALSDLCAAYYEPAIAYLRRSGRTEDAARELGHQFFSRILEHNGLEGADPQRGRFRSYLLGALKHFLLTLRERELRQKRGGGIEHTPLVEATEDGPGVERMATPDPSPDQAFDRQWAMTILDRSLTVVGGELIALGKAKDFEILKPWLTGDCIGLSQQAAGLQLGMSEGAVKVAIHRLRRTFRNAVKQEIASTLNSSADLQSELNHLLAALSH